MNFEFEDSQKLLLGLVLAFALLIGTSVATFAFSNPGSETNNNYKKLLNNIDHSLVSLRMGQDPSGGLKKAESYYDKVVSDRNFENGSDLQELHQDIKGAFTSLIGEGKNADEEELHELRLDVSEMTSDLGAALPFPFHFSALLVLGFSIPSAFLATLLCREEIDWEALREAKETLEEWRKKMLEARRSRGKKKRKMELRDEDRKKNQEKTWEVSIKQAAFYLGPFFLFLSLLGLVYGGWVVAWIPFNWFSVGLLGSIGVSFRSSGWFILTYFGFALIWRFLLIPEEG